MCKKMLDYVEHSFSLIQIMTRFDTEVLRFLMRDFLRFSL